jgi:cold shock protein
MKKGTVKFFNTEKHYGFITMEGGDDKVFVHESALKSPIQENDKVTFDVEETPKGLRAINVSVE